jgi:hypothetical protein
MSEGTERGPSYADLVERARREQTFSTTLSMSDIKYLFSRQAELDTSEDLPVLLPDFKAEIIPENTFHLYAPYTIDADKKSLIIEGTANNNNDGVLTDKVGITVLPDNLKDRVIAAFEGHSDLPNFVKLIIEDAFRGEIAIKRLSVEGISLGITVELRSK